MTYSYWQAFGFRNAQTEKRKAQLDHLQFE